MSALGVPVLVNQNKAYWLSSIGTDVIHSTIQVQELDASVGRFSTLYADTINASTLNVSTLGASAFDVSGMYVSSIKGNTAFFSSMSLASDLSGGVGYVRFSVDASGIQVDGDPIRFDNLVYLTSTINIIQVSTLVDTDIFAANGYFSTLSSGSISGNTVSFNQANISSLYVSSLEGFDISGAEPKDWSLYPTLNSSITFQPGNVLSNVGSELFFNGFNLTDLSGGGQSWSRFPAFSTVYMNNNILTGLSTIVYQDGATLTSLTGNNLQYNGQPIQYGNASNVTRWASYPAVSSVNMANFNLSNAVLLSGSNLNLTGSNVTNGNTFTGTLSVAGTTLIPLASINNLGQLSCQDIDVSNPAVGLADVNIYGATALPGDNALYVEGGVTLAGGAIHGFTAGCLPVAGINTARIDVLQAGVNLLTPTVMAITAGGAIGITAGGALSLAGGGYVEMNTSTLQMINTSQGNKNTTVQAGFLTIDPDLGATSSIKLFNTLGGGVEIDGGGQGSLTGFSTVRGANLSTINLNVSTINGVPLSSIQTPENIICSTITSQSSVTTTLVNNYSQVSTLFWGFGLGISTTIGALRANNIQIADDITGVTNAPMPLESRIVNFSSIQSGTLSTINLVCSTINGVPPGGGGGGSINNFSTLTTSSFTTSSITSQGGEIRIQAPIRFATAYAIENCLGINTDQTNNVNIFANNFGVAAFNTNIGSLSTNNIRANNIRTSTLQALSSIIDVSGSFDVTGNMFLTGTLELPLATGGINFDDGAGTSYSRLMRRDVAANNMLSVVNSPGLASNNMEQLGVGELWVTGGADQYSALRIYNVFPYDNFGMDIIDANGTTMFEAFACGQVPGGFLTEIAGVSSITGFTAIGGQSATGFDNLITVPKISTLALEVSSIVGNDARPAYTNNLMLSTMELYAASTTLMYWDRQSPLSNIHTSGYDVVTGLNGTFKVGTSFQFVSGGPSDEVEFFLLKNGSVLSNSGGIVEVQNNQEIVEYSELIETFVNGDTLQVGCWTSNAGVYVSTIQGNQIQSPAVILTMYKID